MKSGTSFYNRGFGLNLLRRFWPLWVLWLAVLLYAPLQLAGIRSADYILEQDFVNTVNRSFLQTGTELAKLSVFAMPLMAMAMLSYLYDRRSCGLVNSLPMRRETAYFTAFFTGLVPMLAADALVFLLLLALRPRAVGVNVGYLGQWLLLVGLGTVAFYSLACFCGVLTGNVLVLPAVYLVLGCAAFVFESAVHALLGQLVYGYSAGEQFSFLSPLARTLARLNVTALQPATQTAPGQALAPSAFRVEDLGYLAALGAVGLLLGLLAVLIVKRRHMEAAGEIVAVPVLRPLFRVCMSVGTAVIFACLLSAEFLSRLLSGTALAAAVVLLLFLGAALGWFVAEMLIKKSLRVFDRGYRQIGLIAACLALLAVLAEADVFGYERYVPAPDEVASVTLRAGRDHELREPDSIAAYCALHRGVLAHKAENEKDNSVRYWNMPLTYTLKNGRRVTRLYRLISSERAQADPDSDLNRYQALANMPEAILDRVTAGGREIRSDAILASRIDVSLYDGRGWSGKGYELTPEQTVSLFREGILPDAQAGNIGRWFAYESDESRALQSTVGLSVQLTHQGGPHSGELFYWNNVIDLNVLMCAENTRRWLRENLELEAENLAELQSEEMPKRALA